MNTQKSVYNRLFSESKKTELVSPVALANCCIRLASIWYDTAGNFLLMRDNSSMQNNLSLKSCF